MGRQSNVYIAGVGYSTTPSGDSSSKTVTASLVSAGTKALLDAGLTYGDVTHCVVRKRGKRTDSGSEALNAFGEGGITIEEVEHGSELDSSFQLIRNQGVKCTFIITAEKSGTVAFVLVSDDLLWRYPYLKDSSIILRESEPTNSNEDGLVKERYYDVCQMVWTLRGWFQNSKQGKIRLHYRGKQGQCFELRRADANEIPAWKAVEHKQDGKHRLGYNPAAQTKEISLEDFEAVRAYRQTAGRSYPGNQFSRKGGDCAALAKL